MRVLILSQYYRPEPVPKPSELAEELLRRGHEVAVLTGLPNYPSGKLARGYRLTLLRREHLGDVPITRVFEVPYHGRSAIGRIANYMSFMVAAICAAPLMPRPDVIYVWHPPLTVGVSAFVLGAIFRVPFVYDVQDIWPDEALMSGILREGRVVSTLRVLERFVYRRSAHVIVITEAARRNLLSKGVPNWKISVLPHWIYGELPTTSSSSERARGRQVLGATDQFVVTFAGNVGLLQSLETVLEAAAHLRERTDLAFRIVGDGSDRARLERRARELDLKNVVFIGARPITEMPAIFGGSDALLVHLRAGPMTDLVLPAKTLAYLSAGRPLIVAMTGTAAELVLECGAGIAIQPENYLALAEAVSDLAARPLPELEAMGERGRRCAETKFSKSRLIDEHVAILSRFATG